MVHLYLNLATLVSLGQINDYQPFVVTLYYGSSKPESVESFLKDFLEELQLQDGISHKTVYIQLR